MTNKNRLDFLSITTYTLAIIVAILGLLVWMYNIVFLIPNKSVPEILNKPCAILFFMLAVIFFAVGSTCKEET